ncbi:MAG: 2-oxoglutarate dehydrogenase E1 subunit family protein, partial [Ferrovibrionaceae bacterium]
MTAHLDRTSFLYRANAGLIEELYARYLSDPASVDASWAQFFQALGDEAATITAEKSGPSWAAPINWAAFEEADLLGPTGKATKSAEKAKAAGASDVEVRAAALDTIRAAMMIRAYRIRGHLQANLDPLGIEKPGVHPELDPKTYGFTDADMDRPIFIDRMLGLETATVREILAILRRTYCGTIGIEFMHMSDPAQKAWLQERIEGREKEVHFTPEGKLAILKKLTEAEGFERFCHLKYTGTKRFGLEGGEALIPAMEALIKRGGQMGVKEIVLGMPHR